LLIFTLQGFLTFFLFLFALEYLLGLHLQKFLSLLLNLFYRCDIQVIELLIFKFAKLCWRLRFAIEPMMRSGFGKPRRHLSTSAGLDGVGY
jgi:hypothetical protein